MYRPALQSLLAVRSLDRSINGSTVHKLARWLCSFMVGMSSDDGKLVSIHDVHSYSLGFRCRVGLGCFIAAGVGKASDNPRAAGRAVSWAMTTRLMYSLVLHWTCELASGVQPSRFLPTRGPGRRSLWKSIEERVLLDAHKSLTSFVRSIDRNPNC